jgi:hypothetical protein
LQLNKASEQFELEINGRIELVDETSEKAGGGEGIAYKEDGREIVVLD